MSEAIPVTTEQKVKALMRALSDGQPHTKEHMLQLANLYPSELTESLKKSLRKEAEKQGKCVPWTQNGQPWILVDRDANDVVTPESFAFRQVKGTQKSQQRMLKFIKGHSESLTEENRLKYQDRLKENNKMIDQFMAMASALKQSNDDMIGMFPFEEG